MALVLNGDGAIGGLVAGGLPDASVTQSDLAAGVVGNGPAFSVWKSTSGLGIQSITSNAWNKVTFDIEDYDTNNNFASSRFTPTVAGYYQINAEIDCGGSGFIFCSIFKNGSELKRGSGSSGTEVYTMVSSVVYLNGSTDYVEVYILSSGSAGSVYSTTGGQYTYFNGVLVRAA